MRTLVLSLIFILNIQPAAQASDVISTATQQQAKTNQDLADLERNKKDMEAMISDLERKFNLAESKFVNQNSKAQGESLSPALKFDPARQGQLRDEINRLARERAATKAEFEKQKKEYLANLAKIKSDIDSTQQKLITQNLIAGGPIGAGKPAATAAATAAVAQINPAALPLILASHEQEVRAVQATVDLQNIDARFAATDDTIDELERKYDQTEMGTYVQEKVSQLVNSLTICRAMRRCEVKDETPIDAKSIQEELFPESKATRSEHYQKVKTRRTGTSQ